MLHEDRVYIQKGRIILWYGTMAERAISVLSLYFQAPESFLFSYLYSFYNIMRDHLIVSKRNPLNFYL